MEAPKKATFVDWQIRILLVLFIFIPIFFGKTYSLDSYFIAMPLWLIAIKLAELRI